MDTDAVRRSRRPLNVVLHRRHFTKNNIAGELYVNGMRICSTLEYPWRRNQIWSDKLSKDQNFSMVSCVPERIYHAHIRTDGSKGFRIELLGTYPRQFIQIHVGNKLNPNSHGCILAGEFPDGPTTETEHSLIGQSRAAMGRLKQAILPDASKARNPSDWAKMMAEAKITVRIIGMPRNYWQVL